MRIIEKNGARLVMNDAGECIATDQAETYERAARFALDCGVLDPSKTVAWIGGGLCIGPRLFAMTGCVQDVYEIEPALREFCPEGVAFAAGDYRETMRGSYDVIVYDLGGVVPRDFLTRYLTPNGILLPKETI